MYFATLLKTTAPVKLPISQLSLWICFLKSLSRQLKLIARNFHKVNNYPVLIIRFPILVYVFFIHKHIHLSMITYLLVKKTVLDNHDN